METTEELEARITAIIMDGAKRAHKREVWRAVVIAAGAATAIFMWEILLRGAWVVTALF